MRIVVNNTAAHNEALESNYGRFVWLTPR